MKMADSQETPAAAAPSWGRRARSRLRFLAFGLVYLLAIGAFLGAILLIKTSYYR